MTARATALALAGAMLAALLIGGCSGAGVPADRVRQAGVQSTAEDHVTAVLLVKGWFSILHEKGSEPTNGGPPPGPAFQMEFLPDGSMHFWGTFSDGSADCDYLQRPDQSGTGTQTRPDGKTMTITWDVPIITGTTQTQHMEQTFWDGTRFDYTQHVDFSVVGSAQVWDGAAVLADGRAMQFVLNRTWNVADHLELAPPDGSHLQVRVPLTSGVEGSMYWPVFSAGAEGSFTAPSGAQQEFKLTGQGQRWDRWEFTASEGTAGAFTLGEDFDGSGQLKKGGKTIGALRWLPTAFGTLDLLAAASAEVTPSAAAQDFQIDRWVSSIAGMGPMPMY